MRSRPPLTSTVLSPTFCLITSMTLPSASRSVRKSVYKCGVSADHGKSAVSATRRVARATPPRFSPAVRMGTRTAADATPLSFLSHQAVVAPGETGGDAGPHDGDAGTSGHSGASAAPPVGEESSAGDLPPGLASPPAPGRAQPEISSAEQLAGRWRAASSGSRRRGGELARRAAPLAGEPLTKLAGKGAPAPAPGGCSLSANGGASRRGSFENWPVAGALPCQSSAPSGGCSSSSTLTSRVPSSAAAAAAASSLHPLGPPWAEVSQSSISTSTVPPAKAAPPSYPPGPESPAPVATTASGPKSSPCWVERGSSEVRTVKSRTRTCGRCSTRTSRVMPDSHHMSWSSR
mmetsp:Transcript_17835/g.58289  ORF Transcript_17835/g.58289 Transcript_17835/m.58289 type:complete len:348 (-) Transcript_17835:820-1863(-)